MSTSLGSSMGSLVSAGLPNITGGATIYGGGNTEGHGLAITCIGGGSGLFNGGPYGKSWTLDFNASNSNSIYGSSESVTPASLKIVFYISY